MPKNWIASKHIKGIKGARKPSAYLARAYLHQKNHGQIPEWARKAEQNNPELGVRRGDWMFDRDHIEAEAAENLRYMTPKDIRDEIGISRVSRRTVLNWMDAGHLGEVQKVGNLGERRVLRDKFERARPMLEQRLMSPRSIASKKLASDQKKIQAPTPVAKKPRSTRSSQSTAKPNRKSTTQERSKRSRIFTEAARSQISGLDPAEKAKAMVHSSVTKALTEINPDNAGDTIRNVSKALRESGFSDGAVSAARREIIAELRRDTEIDEADMNITAHNYSDRFVYSEAQRLKESLSTAVFSGEQSHKKALREYQRFLDNSGLPEHTCEDLEDELRDELGIHD